MGLLFSLLVFPILINVRINIFKWIEVDFVLVSTLVMNSPFFFFLGNVYDLLSLLSASTTLSSASRFERCCARIADPFETSQDSNDSRRSRKHDLWGKREKTVFIYLKDKFEGELMYNKCLKFIKYSCLEEKELFCSQYSQRIGEIARKLR